MEWTYYNGKVPKDGVYLCTIESDDTRFVDFGVAKGGEWLSEGVVAYAETPQPYQEDIKELLEELDFAIESDGAEIYFKEQDGRRIKHILTEYYGIKDYRKP